MTTRPPSEAWTNAQIEAAIVALRGYIGCGTQCICADVAGDNCECGRLIRRALSAVMQATHTAGK